MILISTSRRRARLWVRIERALNRVLSLLQRCVLLPRLCAVRVLMCCWQGKLGAGGHDDDPKMLSRTAYEGASHFSYRLFSPLDSLSISPVLSLSTASAGTVHGKNLPISGGPCRAHERSSNIWESCYLAIDLHKEGMDTQAAADSFSKRLIRNSEEYVRICFPSMIVAHQPLASEAIKPSF